jgi:hypothetical protein
MAAKLQFKFREGTSSGDREQLIAKLEDKGADNVEPLFPEESDEELATLYSARVGAEDDFDKLLRLLKRSRKVEFAEPELDRRLILPNELNGRRRRS